MNIDDIEAAVRADPYLLSAYQADRWVIRCRECRDGKHNKECSRYPKCRKVKKW